MALNLSTLTNSATSASILNEALTTADLLDPVPILKNLSRGSNKGGDAKQTTALNQPKALPLIDGKGYCYLPVTTGNAPAVTFPTIGANDDFVLEMDVYLVQVNNLHLVSGSSQSERIIIYNSGFSFACNVGNGTYVGSLTLLTEGVSTITVERTSGTVTLKQNGVTKGTINNVTGSANFSHLSFNGQYSTGIPPLNGYIQKATLSIGGTQQLNVDFTATNVRHNDTKFKCATGQVVTVNQSGNDPATIIKKPVLRFANKSDDSTNISLAGLFNQTITDGYMFAAFSVLGDGGEGNGRVFSVDNGNDNSVQGGIFSLGATNNLRSYYRGGLEIDHIGLFDDALGNVLHDVKLTTGSQVSKVNNADQKTATSTGSLSCVNFNISSRHDFDKNAAIDLEYLALFPATITDDQADSVRNFINNRNNVFSLIDSQGYYFFDGAATVNNQVFSGSSSWLGRIIGSDNDDPFKYLSNGSLNDRPTTDGYKITFADNSDHFLFNTPLHNGLAGWQVVGTSLGTFAYRVNANAVTELNLLGNLGSSSYRKVGDLYGIILLPESATGADIEEAKKLLIDRGAASDSIQNDYFAAWFERDDIVDFKSFAASTTTNFNYAFSSMTNLVSFPAMSFPNTPQLINGWTSNTSMSEFGAISAPLCSNFSNAWKSCSALTSFPAGAKLGTEATGTVIFDNAWRSSGLTSFSTPLPTATSASIAWGYCSALTQFNLDSLPLVLNVSQAWRNTGLISFNTNLPSATSVSYAWYQATSLSSFGEIDISSCSNFTSAWQNCSALTSFPAGAKLGTSAVNVNFTNAWRSSGLTSFSTPLTTTNRIVDGFNSCTLLTDFSADVFANWNPQNLASGVFHDTWKGCSALSAISVQNILTSLDASGQHGTYDGTSTGNPLGDSGIDIDYNVATGSLSAATNAAVTSLKSKGWSIIVNNVTL